MRCSTTMGVCLVAAGLVVGACGVGRPRPSPEPPRRTVVVQDGSSSAEPLAGTAGPSASTAVPTDLGAAALSSQILSQVTPPTAETDLPIGPGDLIEISVFEVEEFSKLKLRVPLRGTITLPLVGAMPAAGRTAIELEDDIRARLQQKFMHDPQVSVFVHEQKSQRISVIGAVRRGGVYTLASRLRVADALALAEGLTDDADHVIYLIRRVLAGTVVRAQAGVAREAAGVGPGSVRATEEVMVPIDLEALAGGKEDLNVELEAGDVINVPRAGSYYVGGSVERPGSFFLKSKMTVQQAILAAGGVKDVAAWEDIRLYRATKTGGREVLTFNLKEFEEGQASPEIQKSDVIIVGKSRSKAFWYGFLDFFHGIFGMSKGL